MTPASPAWKSLLRRPLSGQFPPPFAMLALITAFGSMSTHAIFPALPSMARELAVGDGAIQLAVTLYLVGTSAGQLVYGPLSDRFGRRPVVLGGVALFILASWLGSMATSFPLLLGARLLQSLGGCSGLVLGRAIVRDCAPPAKAAGQLALLMVLMILAPGIGPLIGGYVMLVFGWRGVFDMMALIGLIAMLWALYALPETNATIGQTRGARAIMRAHVALLKSGRFGAFTVLGSAGTGAAYSYFAGFPFVYSQVLHHPIETMGWWYAFVLIAYVIGGLSAKRLSTKVPAMTMLRTGVSLSWLATGALLILVTSGHTSLTGLLACGFLYALGASITAPFSMTSALSQFPALIGTASGFYGFAQIMWAALMTFMLSIWHDGTALPMAGVMFGSVTISALVLLAMIGRQPPRTTAS